MEPLDVLRQRYAEPDAAALMAQQERDMLDAYQPAASDPFEAAAARTRRPYRGLPAPGTSPLPKHIQDFMLPDTGLDVALSLVGGPFGKLMGKGLKMATVGGTALLGADPAEAGAVSKLKKLVDPRLWSPISDTKLRKPLDEMEHRFTDVRAPVPKFIEPEELLGGHGIFTPWDLSRSNRTLTHVDGTELERPVRAHGGVGFQEANPGMASASELAISRRLDNQAQKLTEETGKPVYIMPMTMSPMSIDASHHVADPLSQLVQRAKIKPDDAKAFDDMMRAKAPDWPGIQDKGFQDYIANMQGGMTTKAHMADRMGLAGWQGKGFPDVAAVRHAMTEPGLIDVPRNTTGMSIARYVPGKGLLETTHPSYSKGVAGDYVGQLPELLPFDVAGHDIAKGLAEVNARNKAEGKKTIIQPAYHMGRPSAGVPTSQTFDQQWLDRVMQWWER